MAVPTNTVSAHNRVGIREDLEDVIYSISPTETPFMTNIAKGTADQVKHEWQTDALASASTGNAQVEGDDVATFDSRAATTRLQNYCQISRKTVVVSGTNSAVNSAGRNDELAYQLAKMGKELKRDMESILLNNQAASAGTASTARTLAGLPSWLTNAVRSAGTSTPGADPTGDGSDVATDSDLLVAFSEDNLKAVILECYQDGGDPDMIMVGPFNKQKFSGFTGSATKYKNVEDRTIVATADIYVSDFGELSVVPNRFQRERDAFVLQSDMFECAFLRPFQTKDLASSGDNDKRLLLAEYTLVSRNGDASGVIADCTTS